MIRFKRKNHFTPNQFSLTSAGVLGTSQKFALDRTWPIEEILLHVDVTCGATGPTPRTGSSGQVGLDALFGVVKKVDLWINDGVQPRSIVNFSGIGLIEYAQKVGINLDANTLEYLRLWSLGAAYANNLQLSYTIRIPLVHPLAAEPLRGRCLLPVNTHPQDPILTLDFESGSNMYSAGSISAVAVTVDLIRREMTKAQTDEMIKTGGFINYDLLEVPNSIAVGVSGEQRFNIPTPGYYANLLFRQYLGGATVARDVLDQTTTFGAEQRWRLESGGVVLRDWRWKQLKVINQLSNCLPGVQHSVTAGFIAPSSAGSPTVATALFQYPHFGGTIAANTAYTPASSALADFVTDDVETFNELGSTLDCEIGAKSGLKMEVIGSVASVATTASTLYIGGHRFYDSPLVQKFMVQ